MRIYWAKMCASRKKGPFFPILLPQAKGQPREQKIANAPTLPHTIEVIFALFVKFVIILSITSIPSNSG
ncbi:hypothetical protein [Xanthocytophaga agilis]|uniref:Uncharacterized protein n=1 Tax=Xanthocytophaga agilis TaxID=3048010 RepID=A0AAE3R0V6_9BACT|nr:hypothetical protein [Xanthocytophaga agilis]MDJ1501591.1 hypothetical protein [Xanthocytophaga agilis]